MKGNQSQRSPQNSTTPSRSAARLSLLAGLALLAVAAGWLVATSRSATAASLAQSADQGAQIFQQRCAACHTLGGGDLVGPDLQGVTQRRDLAWLKQFIQTPDQLIAAGDPIAAELLAQYNNVAMPNLGLSAAEVDTLVAYLENPGAAAAGPALPAGRASLGLQLFTGQQPLENGGTPCLACHSVQGISALGGGALGPDLTNVYTRFGDAGLAGALSGLPFPTMVGVFKDRPLTPQEQSDLASYFKTADSSAPAGPAPLPTWVFWLVGTLGMLALFAILAYYWPRQRHSANELLRTRSTIR